MATLASIPEVNTSLASTHDGRSIRRAASFERIRPRSRVLVLSRRPTRVRNPVRRAQGCSNAPSQASSVTHQPTQLSGSHPHTRLETGHRTSSMTKNFPQASQRPARACQVDEVSPMMDPALETSMSSIDLDSFPLPPSANLPLRQHQSRVTNEPLPKADAPPGRGGVIMPTRDGGLSAARRGVADVAADVARGAKHASVDSTLVDAISRAVLQQLRLFSAAKQTERDMIHPSKSNYSPSFARVRSFANSGRREALNRFTADLHKYAERTGAKGKRAHSSPDPPRSGESLRTVSDLMPFRPEFRAAGLAVTSKDQAQRTPGRTSKACALRRPRRYLTTAPQNKHLHSSQLDGHAGEDPSTSANTEISFAPSQDVDEWRYALIDEVPVRKPKRGQKVKKPRNHCLSCFPAEEDSATEADWAHFRQAPKDAAQERGVAPGPVSRTPPPSRPPPPRPVEIPPLRFDSAPLSPRHVAGESRRQSRLKTKEGNAVSESMPRPRAQTARPEHSVSLPRNYAPAETYGGRLSSSRGEKMGRKQGLGPDALPPRSKSDQAGPAQGAKKREQETVATRPHQNMSGRGTGRTMSKATSGAMLKEDRSPVASALPSTWGRQDGPIPNLEEELEKTAQLVAETRPPARGILRPASSARRPRRSTPRYDPNHAGICCRSSRGLPSRATAPPNIPKRTSSIRGSISSDDADADDGGIADRDVLRGLHVAASAACDDEVDAFVRSRTGLRIRRFLADLMTLEAFGSPRPGEGSERRARRRRAEMRKLKQQVRRSRELAAVAGGLI